MSYRVRCSLYRIEASSLEEAKKKALDIIGKNLEEFISVEVALEKRPLWRMLLTGR
jgi:hypothetical protein